ncbi:MAG: 5-(carboxyamino)imidazole ribonucleotide mutase [Sphingobacteriia bacterium]|nr:5-(carboxyamino)imidazole ribonucleotide mutase [Sphingobacteriia bacterium]
MNKECKVGIIMGSTSDLSVMSVASELFRELGISYEERIVSAHRTPLWMVEYASNAQARGLEVIIAGAGGAAHLPGMVASLTILPVIGVPIKSTHSLNGLDSLLSIVQMPSGVPVATMAIDGAKNAALFAARILALNNPDLSKLLIELQEATAEKIKGQDEEVYLK